MVSLLQRLGLLLATLVVLSVIGEFAIRVVFRDITTTADNGSYFARRWKKSHVRRNTLGLREREFEWNKPNGLYRIVVIGDSFTFGQGIPERDRFTNLLEKKLTEQGSDYKYEVLNFGRPGTDTLDHVAFLREVAIESRPDFVLLQWYFNDIEGRDRSGRPKVLPLLPFGTRHSQLHRSSALYYLINQQWHLLQEALGISGSYDEYMLQRFGDPESTASQDAMLPLKDFIERCQDTETAVGIVLFPHFSDLGRDYPFGFLHDRVLRLCTEKDISCLDLRSIFTAYGTEYRKLWVNQFDSHPGPLANRLAAEAIMSAFGQTWLSRALGKPNGSLRAEAPRWQ
jgi:hypothetical protein